MVIGAGIGVGSGCWGDPADTGRLPDLADPPDILAYIDGISGGSPSEETDKADFE